MTPNRAKEIQQEQAEWPYWGALQRTMTADEISEVNELWDTMPGYTCFADALNRIARA